MATDPLDVPVSREEALEALMAAVSVAFHPLETDSVLQCLEQELHRRDALGRLYQADVPSTDAERASPPHARNGDIGVIYQAHAAGKEHARLDELACPRPGAGPTSLPGPCKGSKQGADGHAPAAVNAAEVKAVAAEAPPPDEAVVMELTRRVFELLVRQIMTGPGSGSAAAAEMTDRKIGTGITRGSSSSSSSSGSSDSSSSSSSSSSSLGDGSSSQGGRDSDSEVSCGGAGDIPPSASVPGDRGAAPDAEAAAQWDSLATARRLKFAADIRPVICLLEAEQRRVSRPFTDGEVMKLLEAMVAPSAVSAVGTAAGAAVAGTSAGRGGRGRGAGGGGAGRKRKAGAAETDAGEDGALGDGEGGEQQQQQQRIEMISVLRLLTGPA